MTAFPCERHGVSTRSELILRELSVVGGGYFSPENWATVAGEGLSYAADRLQVDENRLRATAAR